MPDAAAHEADDRPDQAAITILYDARFELHDTGPDHPEQAQRVSAIVERLQHSASLKPWLRWPTFSAATRADLLRVHSPAYVELLDAEQAGVKPGEHRLLSTGDTVISAHSVAVAMLASGAGMAGVDAVMHQQSPVAFALVRPPGHHATRERGMGFCLTNHIAVAARYAQQHYAIQRILIVDIDVHHGNGTQAIFEADNSVFYFSAHQHPLYPGSGRASEKGVGAGTGYTMNVDVPPSSDEHILLRALDQQLVPAMRQFRPQLIMVSAGLDAHAGDRLGALQYSDRGYGEVATRLKQLAETYAQGRMVWLLEGGYVPLQNADAVEAMIGALLR
ncbi:histone deacetylase [Methylophilus sp. 5]|uniref:histone deacetylase family protein n=1 Tax=Methylophilus sp. 5 TaxID=1112274 RepID=UPI0004BBDB12|nr:histone deacetylase [Methylophilus sp. 5]